MAVFSCRYLDAFFQRLDYEPVERFCRACLKCKGTILFTGVGKSGFIAQKISQTLVGAPAACCSTGLPPYSRVHETLERQPGAHPRLAMLTHIMPSCKAAISSAGADDGCITVWCVCASGCRCPRAPRRCS